MGGRPSWRGRRGGGGRRGALCPPAARFRTCRRYSGSSHARRGAPAHGGSPPCHARCTHTPSPPLPAPPSLLPPPASLPSPRVGGRQLSRRAPFPAPPPPHPRLVSPPPVATRAVDRQGWRVAPPAARPAPPPPRPPPSTRGAAPPPYSAATRGDGQRSIASRRAARRRGATQPLCSRSIRPGRPVVVQSASDGGRRRRPGGPLEGVYRARAGDECA